LPRHAFKRTSDLVKARIADVSRPLNSELHPVLVRNSPRHPIHPAALLRQSKGRWYTTHSTVNAALRRFMSTGSSGGVKYDRSAFPKSSIGNAVTRLTTRAPFASTLRPNLTGGALPRTAGGYTIGGGRTGGARYFSHTPAAPAQVVNNVSAAVRTFWLSGHKAQFDGMTPTGNKRYRAITSLQEETGRKMQSIHKLAPGSFIDFRVNPTITALSPLGATFPFSSAMKHDTPTLNTEGFLDVLSVDFARALKELSAVMNDLKRLSLLGDLPISLENQSTLRVRFPGCDAETVERLCIEVGVKRGTIHQDPDFDANYGGHMALMFPFASTSEHTLSSPGGSLRSETGHDLGNFDDLEENPWLSLPEGYETMDDLSETESMYFERSGDPPGSSDYEGLEGIYRFIEECDNARGKI
jgi:hypothetical protein